MLFLVIVVVSVFLIIVVVSILLSLVMAVFTGTGSPGANGGHY